ncbi:protein kinase [Gemmatirosa kalamazoonensis]|uniref:non-specific serine/threonine protein kinase n=1 Tax=Gemmatirosa kalamazoonensis TaxID=861299 RepID=W0RFI7_9BACT|nr:protein kinase [Gemmatirosa kalamazoonensis]AHG88153.1 protein kinase [Gemmatirosa kalamazoonensis]
MSTRQTAATPAPRFEPYRPPEHAPMVHSFESGRSYRLERLIGKGGFGEVYLATAEPRGAMPERVCVKVSDRFSAWLREAYFAELLGREPRALKVFDRFAHVDGTQMRYCLAMEYAEHGDLGAWLARKGAQSERLVRREIAGILRALDALHRGNGLHRDLTAFNIFVCKDEQLKLGDFGIATHQLSRRGVTADAFNPFDAPAEIAWGKVRRWQQRDDVYQIGMIAAMLLRGDTTSPMRSKDVRNLPCSDHLKEVIYRCLGVRGKRYESAGELIAALRQRPAESPKLGRVTTLAGCRVAFTGFLSRPRSEAMQAAREAGATVQSKPGHTTDVLVRGRPNVQQIAGAAGGSKLLEVRRLAAQGQPVRVIGEAQFWRLVAPTPRKAAPSRGAPARARR